MAHVHIRINSIYCVQFQHVKLGKGSIVQLTVDVVYMQISCSVLGCLTTKLQIVALACFHMGNGLGIFGSPWLNRKLFKANMPLNGNQ